MVLLWRPFVFTRLFLIACKWSHLPLTVSELLNYSHYEFPAGNMQRMQQSALKDLSDILQQLAMYRTHFYLVTSSRLLRCGTREKVLVVFNHPLRDPRVFAACYKMETSTFNFTLLDSSKTDTYAFSEECRRRRFFPPDVYHLSSFPNFSLFTDLWKRDWATACEQRRDDRTDGDFSDARTPSSSSIFACMINELHAFIEAAIAKRTTRRGPP